MASDPLFDAPNEKVPYVCLAGPTASGKTAAALAFAARVPVEIVSVDSALVYRGMDIGTAKPTLAERDLVPHHLIDIIDPTEAYSAAQFVADAKRLVEEIRARGRLPVLVGGTMLYFKALLEGIDELPAADAAVRAEIDLQAARNGWPWLHAELARLDPATAQRLAPNDAQRIQRALEVYRLTGRPISSFHTGPERRGELPAPLVSLEPADRQWLHTRIAQRLHRMLEDGLVDEVRSLRARGDLSLALPSMRCVGYRQVWEMLDGAYDLDELPARAIAATRQLAKRQLTWLRAMPERTVVACDRDDALEHAVSALHRAARGWA
ncbi:MAG TPA: tRNA (adenosine(37)-N6)-dimethylallyltransferase MiaA [Burkholderiaceae bacterium]|nr:tRNA (adenosine(37)-N6)-dimethylallyltransferase MiaA [Burkholderiaceae bacterium]